MSSISQIYFHILNIERRRVKMLPAWRRFWHWKKSKSNMFMEALARMSDLDIAKITEDALGYRLPQFNRQSETLNRCSSLDEFRDDKPETPKIISSKSNGIEQQGRRFEAKKFELEKVDCGESEVVMDMSSLSLPSPSLSAANSDAWHHSQINSKMDFVARRFSVFSSQKSNESILKRPIAQVRVADGTELCEVIVSGGNSDDAAGIGQLQSQQQQSIALGGQTVQREAAAAGVDCAPPTATSRAAVAHTKTLAALALNPRGRGNIGSFLAAVRKSTETRDNAACQREHSPNGSRFALPTSSASSQPGLSPSAHVAAPQLQVNLAAAQTPIPPPPPRSRSRSRNMATATIDLPASVFNVPPPPPRSRSSSRTRVSAGAAGPQAQVATKSSHEPTQKPSAHVVVPVPDVAVFQPPEAAKRPPDVASHTSGGSVRAGASSKKAGSKQPKKSSTDLLQERLQSEYEESMRRMQREGVSFAEC